MPTFNTTTLFGLRWLTGANKVRDIDAGFQALAEDVDALILNDAKFPWTALSLHAGLTDAQSGVRKEPSGRIGLRGNLTNASGGVLSPAATIFTVPSGFRPARTVVIPACMFSGPTMLSVTTAGVVQLTDNLASGGVLYLDGITWPVS